jgi:hypothetical protein
VHLPLERNGDGTRSGTMKMEFKPYSAPAGGWGSVAEGSDTPAAKSIPVRVIGMQSNKEAIP